MMDQVACRVLVPGAVSAGMSLPSGTVGGFGGNCMGTSWQVRLAGCDEQRLPALQKDAAGILETIEAQMSHFRKSSQLSRFSRLEAGERMQLSAEFAHVMRTALEVAHASAGAFDPTLGAEIAAWGFGAGARYSDFGFRMPTNLAASRMQAWQSLMLDADDRLLQPGGISLNLSAIAKGFGVDAVSGFLTRLGFDHHLVEVGGELRGSGMKPNGQPWWVALEWPAADCPLPATRIALHGLSVATSGNYRNGFQSDGCHYQHTLDPVTGAPVMHRLASVSVVHTQCMLADAWATAIMAQGPVNGLRLAERHSLAALLQWPDESGCWHEISSSVWKEMEQ